MALARSVAQSWSGLGFLGGRGAPSRPAIIFRLLGAADAACRVRLAAADSVRAAGAAAAPTGQRCGVGTARPLHPFSAWSLSLSPNGLPGPACKQPARCVRTGRRPWPRLSDPGRPGSCGSCRHVLRFVKMESGSTSPLASLIHHDLLRFLRLALYTHSFLLSAQCPSSASSHRTWLPRCRVLSRTGFQLPWFKQHLSPLMTQAAVCGSHSRCPLMALCREGRRAPAGLVSPRVIFVVLKHLLF